MKVLPVSLRIYPEYGCGTVYSWKYGVDSRMTYFKRQLLSLRWKIKAFLIKLKIFYPKEYEHKPQWVKVLDGPLTGHQLFLDVNSTHYWQDMILGNYDKFIYDWINNHGGIKGKVIWDVGAHFGYHAMSFAVLAGKKGKVIAIEPNNYNIQRLKIHLNQNPDLKNRMQIIETALSNKNGTTDFVYIDKVDDGRSMGSHLGNILAPEGLTVYEAFTHKQIKTCKADTLMNEKKIPIPYMIKIDVEGAEQLVLEGGTKLLLKYKPILILEIHNISQMFYVQKLLFKLGYKINILDNENNSLSRCFVVARDK